MQITKTQVPLISVIVPAYIAERTIRCCLNSILKQTLNDIEIIVVNDGSTDKTQDILIDYHLRYGGG